MCLAEVTQTEFDPELEMDAYKVIMMNSSNTGGFTPMMGTPVAFGSWISDVEIQKIYLEQGECYKSGFHCFVDAKEAEKYRDCLRQFYKNHLSKPFFEVVHVKVKEIVAMGTGDGWASNESKVVVARQIFFTRCVEENPSNEYHE